MSIKKVLVFLFIGSLFIGLAINPNLRAKVVANFGFGSALFISVLIPAYASYLWDYFAQGRPFLFFLLYFASLTGFFLSIPDKEFYNFFFFILSAKWHLVSQDQYLFSLLAILGLFLIFHFGGNIVLNQNQNYSLKRFLLLTALYLVYISLVLKSLHRTFTHS